MRIINLNARVDRCIDHWFFRMPWVKAGEQGDRLSAIYKVYIRRGSVQSVDGDAPEMKFRALLDEKETSREIYQLKGKIWIEAGSLAELRDKCEADFNSYGPQDWKKIILVALHRPGTHKNEGKEIALHFGYAILETTGGRYRTTDERSHVSRDKTWLIEGEENEIVELPYTEELEAKLAQIREAIEVLSERLTDIVADPKKLLSTKFPQLLK